MSIICKPQKPNPTVESIIAQQLNRDLGLSSVFNVNTDVVPCLERFESPDYVVSGACKSTTVSSGLTGCHYNLSEVDDIDLIFRKNILRLTGFKPK